MKNTSLRNLIYLCFLLLIVSIPNLSEAKDVYVVISSNIKPYNDCFKGFAGTFEGSYEKTYLTGKETDFEEIVNDIRITQPKLILTIGTPAFNRVKDEITDLPIIFSMVLNPQIPKGRNNITGVTMNIDLEIRMKYLKQILPEAKNIGILLTSESKKIYGHKINAMEKKNGVKFVQLLCENAKNLPNSLAELDKEIIDCILLFPDPILLKKNNFSLLLMFSFKNNIPLIGVSPKYVKKGALYGLYSDYISSGEQSQELVSKVLSGKDAGDIPVQDIQSPNLILNINIAKKMNLEISSDVIKSAKTIYE